MNINLKFLQAFLEVAEHQSFNRAAEAIGRTQSAVSMQIQQLEAQLGRQLFTRTTRRVRLTFEGEQLLTHVRSAMAELMVGLRQAGGLPGSHQGRVAVACAPSIASTRLPDVVARFNAAYPAVSVQLRELTLSSIVESVRQQDVDFGIGPEPLLLNGLSFRSVLVDPICAVFPTGTIKARDPLPLAALADQTIILMGGLRARVEDEARDAGLSLEVRYEAQQFPTVMGLVRAGLGVGIVPRIAISARPGRGITVAALAPAGLVRKVGIITQRGRVLSPVAIEFANMLECSLGAKAVMPAHD